MRWASLVQVGIFCAAAMHGGAADEDWETVTTYQAKPLEEISGLAPSGIRPGVLWAHNDSGGAAALHAVDLEGQFLGTVAILGTKNRDWEDMSAFKHQGRSYLLIADTGDNARKHKTVSLHAVVEPEPKPDGSYGGLTGKPSWTITFRYEDGPQDCESIAVLPEQDRVFLLNKHSKVSVVYEVPLFPNKKKEMPLVARKLAVLPEISNAAGNVLAFFKAGFFGTRATGMDLSPGGRHAVALTYTDIRIFHREDDEPWATAFRRPPRVVALPSIYQPEALCFSPDGRSIYVSSEESPTPLVRYSLNE